jgi:hypothetical protein
MELMPAAKWSFPALPVHDALVAPSHSIDRAAEKMVEVFETLLGCVNPCQIKIKKKKVPHMGERRTFSPTSFPSVLSCDTAAV